MLGGGRDGGGGIEVLLGGLQGGVDAVALWEAIPPRPEPRGREEKWIYELGKNVRRHMWDNG
jgi:hypothetical protein